MGKISSKIFILVLIIVLGGVLYFSEKASEAENSAAQNVEATENIETTETSTTVNETTINTDINATKGDVQMTYKQITMDDAKKIFDADSDAIANGTVSYIILDVRREDEFAAGHIPGAINVANESIDTEAPAELPDKDQVIYVYCRSGNRSKQAASKLAAIGYTNIIEFGGIIDWTGEIEK